MTDKMMTERIGVIIPVYGESSSICGVLSRLQSSVVSTVCLIVDTPLRKVMNRVREAARESSAPVHIIKNRDRTGVGYSIKQGLAYLRETGHTIAVVMAGNGKDDPAEIDRLIQSLLQNGLDYVQGSRYLPGGRSEGMPLVRRVFNRLYPLLWTCITQRRCTDVTNGFRCYKLRILNDGRINLDQTWLDGYSLEYYLHYKVLVLGYRVKEVPVSKIYPYGNKGGYSKIQPLKDWWPIISPLVLLCLGVKR